jgi:hypothetical protein
LFYDFNDFEDGGSVDLFENNNYNFGFTSASYNSNLYMWIKNEVVCFSNDFLSSYPIPYSLSNGREISKLKVVKNGVQPEEFFTFCYVKDSSGKRIYFSSIFGFMEVPSTCVGFDLMMY